ncbi:MAG: hypothetical protein WBA39_33985 [Rivularia sp. (in: cyanobacteria)]
MTEAATLVPISQLAPMFTSIGDKDYSEFKKLELAFAEQHGVETWEDVFNFRVLPALDKDAKSWLLVQKCSKGYTVREMV